MLTPRSICQPITIGDNAVQKTIAAAPSDFFLSTGAFDPTTLSTRTQMRFWMKDALPGDEVLGTAERYRVRYEPTPAKVEDAADFSPARQEPVSSPG